MAKKSEGSTIAVRVLSDCHLGKVNDVVEIDAAMLDAYVRVSYVDPDADAVEYARSLKQ